MLRTAVAGIQAQYKRKGHRIQETIDSNPERNPRSWQEYKRPGSNKDRLFMSSIDHDSKDCVDLCASNPFHLVLRCERSKYEDNPTIHYGLITSANQLMKDATVRDKLFEEKNVFCFEIEAAGLMNNFSYLVVRGHL